MTPFANRGCILGNTLIHIHNVLDMDAMVHKALIQRIFHGGGGGGGGASTCILNPGGGGGGVQVLVHVY